MPSTRSKLSVSWSTPPAHQGFFFFKDATNCKSGYKNSINATLVLYPTAAVNVNINININVNTNVCHTLCSRSSHILSSMY
ncbi:hypothetical protein PP707_00905 [Acetobacter pasteurianus]|nr:hypothetical protein [Acetobacter pasteurianus]